MAFRGEFGAHLCHIFNTPLRITIISDIHRVSLSKRSFLFALWFASDATHEIPHSIETRTFKSGRRKYVSLIYTTTSSIACPSSSRITSDMPASIPMAIACSGKQALASAAKRTPNVTGHHKTSPSEKTTNLHMEAIHEIWSICTAC